MGKRGPAPTPSVVKEARGSWRAKENAAEPVVAVAAPPCPQGLPAAAKKHWKWIVPQLIARRTLSAADLGFLAAMCIEWADYMEAVADVAELKASRQEYEGRLVDHPRFRQKGAFERYSKAAVQFGLSPASKARVVAEPEKAGKNSKGRFFGGPRLAGSD